MRKIDDIYLYIGQKCIQQICNYREKLKIYFHSLDRNMQNRYFYTRLERKMEDLSPYDRQAYLDQIYEIFYIYKTKIYQTNISTCAGYKYIVPTFLDMQDGNIKNLNFYIRWAEICSTYIYRCARQKYVARIFPHPLDRNIYVYYLALYICKTNIQHLHFYICKTEIFSSNISTCAGQKYIGPKFLHSQEKNMKHLYLYMPWKNYIEYVPPFGKQVQFLLARKGCSESCLTAHRSQIN